MRVFVTGATGWVGLTVVKDLLAAGHQVLGLARSDNGADSLRSVGAEVHRGSLEDIESLKSGVKGADGVIHTAFSHDFSKVVENCAVEIRAIEALGAVLEGSKRPLIGTSGVALLSPGKVSDEKTPPRIISDAWPRDPEGPVARMAARGINATIVRLAPSVHGHGDHGFVPILINLARQKGVSAYVGDGQNRWPGVHRIDAARVYRLALENGAQGGPFHAIAEEGVPFKQIAEVIGRRLNIPVVSKTPQEAQAHFGWFAGFAGIDCPAASAITRSVLKWQPTQPGLIADIDHQAYFAA